MIKNLLAALIPWLCLTFLQAQAQSLPQKTAEITQDTIKKRVYYVWVNSPKYSGRYLWGITDSTITVGTSKKKSDIGLKTYTAEQVKWVKFRQKGGIGKRAGIGFLAGAAFGFLLGYAQGNDSNSCFVCFSAADKGLLSAMFLAPTGMIVGALVGGIKTKIPINGSRNTLAQQRAALEKYKMGQ